MNKWIERGLIFIAGAAVGVAGSYKFLEKKFEKVLENEIEDIRSHYRSRITNLVTFNMENSANKDNSQDGNENKESSKHDSPEKEEYENSIENGTDYTGYVKRTKPNTVIGTTKSKMESIKDELDRVSKAVHDNDFDEHMADRESPEEDEPDIFEEESQRRNDEIEQAKNDGVKPYAITRSEYMNQKEWYEKLSWNLYNDDIVTDERDELVLAAEDRLGDDLIESFGVDPDQPNVAYIRNEAIGTDFEVSRIDEDYYVLPGQHTMKKNLKGNIKLSSEE